MTHLSIGLTIYPTMFLGVKDLVDAVNDLGPLALPGLHDSSSIFTDSAGLLPASTNDNIGLVRDLSGNDNHMMQVDTDRPTLKVSGGQLYLENVGSTASGLVFAADLAVRQAFFALQYEDGVEPNFLNLATISSDVTGVLSPTSNLMRGDHGEAVFQDTEFQAEINGAGLSSTILPLPWALVAVRRVTGNTQWSLGAVGSKSGNFIARRWTGRFAPVAFFDRVLTESEHSTVRDYSANFYGTPA